MDELQNKILEWVSKTDYNKGLNYNEDYIEHVSTTGQTEKKYQFLVESESSYRKYIVQIDTNQYKNIKKTYCTCPQFLNNGSCKHVAACLICYSDILLAKKNEKTVQQKTTQLFQLMEKEYEENVTKKSEVFLFPELCISDNYYENTVELKAKIGQEKTYALLGKFNNFYTSLKSEMSYRFGANFSYEPSKHYFSDQSLHFLEYIKNLKSRTYYSGNSTYLDSSEVKALFNIYKEGVYINGQNKVTPIVNGFPFATHLSKNSHEYHLEVSLDQAFFLTKDGEYILNDNKIYHLDKKQIVLLNEIVGNDLEELVFDEREFPSFQKSVLRAIKDKLELDESVSDIIMEVKPEVKFYFDLNENDINCIPKFVYNNEEVSYFAEAGNVIRDIDYENEIVSILQDYGFHKLNNIYLLDDFDLMCEFVDTGLDEISAKYPVYTSEKIQNTNLIKNNSVTTHFSIGKDQILHFDFDLGNVKNDELDSILASIKNKKKYYRLQNGDILSLEQESLQELNDLTEDLDLTKEDMENGTIPKYRALYLDSLKEKKYGIIETDSLFKKFINQFKEFKNSDLEFTKEELNTLRDYQVSGVKWLYMICKCGFGGILADEMGLGKSLQTIMFIKKMYEENKDCKFLIVCPTALVYNWENEFQKFAPDLSYQVFAGNRQERQELLKGYNGNIYITSYGLLREDLDIYETKDYRVFVIDEAQNIKNPKTGLTKAVKSITAETKIALTGTPIENTITELWSIFDFIMPGFLSSLVKFQQKYHIKDFDEDTNKLLTNLKAQVKPFILRRKKKDVIKDLPDKIENNIFIDLNEMQKKYYAAEVKRVNDEMDKLVNAGGFTKNKMMILALLTRLRQICIHPSIYDANYKGESAKMEALLDTIKELVSNSHKILLFTSFKTALYLVKDALNREGISTYVIDGSVPSKQRQILVDAFNKDKTNVFLIMLKSGGTGLNLTSADVVIHLDLWWNPQAENQATDRTHRIGQTKTVEVIKLICKGTIEEKILSLQEKKKLLSDKMIEKDMDDNAYLKSLSEKDIRDLLAYENKD